MAWAEIQRYDPIPHSSVEVSGCVKPRAFGPLTKSTFML